MTPLSAHSKSTIFTEWISHTHVHSNKTPNTPESKSERLCKCSLWMCAQSQIVFSLWIKEQTFHTCPIKESFNGCSSFWNNGLCQGPTPSNTNYTSQCDVLLWQAAQGTESNEPTTIWKKTFITRWVTGKNYSLVVFSWLHAKSHASTAQQKFVMGGGKAHTFKHV